MSISVNGAYDGKVRRFKSAKYKEWLALCETYPQKSYTYIPDEESTIHVEYKFYSKWYNLDGSVKMKDVSNFIKVVEDYLPNIIKDFDDKYIFEFTTEKIHSDREEVEIIIKEIVYEVKGKKQGTES